MSAGARAYMGAAAAVAVLVGAVGAALPEVPAAAVWVGVALGFAAQAVGFWLFFEVVSPESRLVAHGLGMLWRMVVFAVAALLLLRSDLGAAASMLFALVAFFFLSTVLEPLFLRTEPLKRR